MTAVVVPSVCVAAICLNVPFGAWRATLRRLSWQWFLAIHLPIPFIFVMRRGAGLSWHWIPVMLACAVCGQLLGSYLYGLLRQRRATPAAIAEPDESLIG